MPATDSANLKEKVRHLPHKPGVYLMKDRLGQVLYVGKAKDLKKRVSTYFQPSRKFAAAQPKIIAMVELVRDLEVIEVRSEAESLLLEGRLIKQFKPKYNTDFTDNKQFLLVRVELTSALPRFRLTRNRLEDGCRYFGPFAHSGLLRQTLSQMRRKFGILLGDGNPQLIDDGGEDAEGDPTRQRWQLYDDARAEIYGHPNVMTQAEYRERVEEACAFLEGKAREWLAELKKAMAEASENREYERAADLRDRIQALERTITPQRRFTRLVERRNQNTHEVLSELQGALELKRLPRHLECFDISHISGTFVVASMVRFTDGFPDKNQYRRYRIRSFVGNDDFRAMEEVVGRRYRRLHEEKRPFPDLVVIDGGLGQVHAAMKAFMVLDLEPPPLIGLAKREETIVFPDGRESLQLGRDNRARFLLQRLRDEAHRFANTFNAELRSRKIRESILDDFPGLGKVRRAALMEEFKSLERLRKASADDLQRVEGIGPKLAAQLVDFLAGPDLEDASAERAP
ncbi:MAG: GIY-YIG nuclease family protein [Opitutales bacterium]